MNDFMTDMPLMDATFTIVDTETTGMNPYKGARMCEIAAIKVKPGLELDMADTYSSLINPERPIPYSCYRIHGISDEMVRYEPKLHDVMPEFAEFVAGTYVVAHNAPFDVKFINHAMEDTGIVCKIQGMLDTVRLSRKLMPELKSHSLDNLIKHHELDIDVPGEWRHRALFDAVHTAVIFQRLMEKVRRMGFSMVSHAVQIAAPSGSSGTRRAPRRRTQTSR